MVSLVAEPAVAAAYALLGQSDVLSAASAVVRGYHRELALDEDELAALYPLIAVRLAVSVANSAQGRSQLPHDPYLTISEAPAWAALERLSRVPPALAHATFRWACGLPPLAGRERTLEWLDARSACAPPAFAGVLDADLRSESHVFDLGASSLFLGADPRAAETGPLTEAIFATLRRPAQGRRRALRRGARRLRGAAFAAAARRTSAHRPPRDRPLRRRRARTVRAPLDGVVHARRTTTTRRTTTARWSCCGTSGAGRGTFFTLYGHLSRTRSPASRRARPSPPAKRSRGSARRTRTAAGRRTCTSS